MPGAGRKRTQVVLTLQEGDLETGVVGVVRAQSSFLPHVPGWAAMRRSSEEKERNQGERGI